jgi:hypothetical protein
MYNSKRKSFIMVKYGMEIDYSTAEFARFESCLTTSTETDPHLILYSYDVITLKIRAEIKARRMR